MAPDRRGQFRRSASARLLFVGTIGALALSVLVQALFAGDAAVLAPQMWQAHVAWVHIFQWLTVVLPVAAHFADRRIEFTALNCAPMVLIGLQYMLIHFAINHGRAIFAGLHAVGGVLLFGFLVFVFQEWRHRNSVELDEPHPE
jgi:Family of unknown function (DUF6220)